MAEDPSRQEALRIIMKSGEPFTMAELWETWKDAHDNVVPSCSIITTTANHFLAPIHNRMPVILTRELEELWLDPRLDDAVALAQILVPSADDDLEAYEVSTKVNSSTNNSPEVIARLDCTG